ncbi:hypothetical protein BDP81DRAFT_333920 [Colletotrichum phormii]|uniref:Zn(2)-C6 fungal-type domain-containing protein n=1 Tax=Colletotrichum phormii TaxID=359342 RepID=A0AAI9ZDM0_9PEZI|nr:uncharacterized protein BDP81DRAFT_333920 [Colletotrichum phormii]KAK1622595.1 hypothetical protein BDP81DRAFT_333920 [Colletotrichum phormii]
MSSSTREPTDEPAPEDTHIQRPIRRRGGAACRRCRRLRSKCVKQNSQPPCEACRHAGTEAVRSCTFPRRGDGAADRQFRRRSRPLPLYIPDDTDSPGSPDGFSIVEPARSLPPNEEVAEGCRTFVTSYFQLGFIPKAMFQENLAQDPLATSNFLLCCILSISSRFTPILIRRFGTAAEATNHFLEQARGMVSEEMYQPSLENTQAFFLLAIAEWGNGDKERSSMDMGVAVRMATLLKLHLEETYALPPNAKAEQVVRAESARRTFWMIQSQENLHSGHSTPTPFPLEAITALLPCPESDFAFGVAPEERAALPGTPPAIACPRLVRGSERCLFATLIQAHNLWGKVARQAGHPADSLAVEYPWRPQGRYATLAQGLKSWEAEIPPKQKWSVWNLRGWRAEGLHLAYLSVVMVLRLSNIVLRRAYINYIILALSPIIAGDEKECQNIAPEGFWIVMSNELFDNVVELHEQVEAYFSMRARDEGFPAILVFCVYMCGSLSSYLWRHPCLCPHVAPSEAEGMALGSLRILSELHQAWPTSTRWQQGLQQVASPLSVTASPVAMRSPGKGDRSSTQDRRPILATRKLEKSALLAVSREEGIGEMAYQDWQSGVGNLPQMDAFPDDLFDAELAAFLNGESSYSLLSSMP